MPLKKQQPITDKAGELIPQQYESDVEYVYIYIYNC